MYREKEITAILLMGGKGKRFGSEKPKQFHRLAGKPVYQHTLEIFQKLPFDEILIVCHPDWISEIQVENVRIIAGGNTRQESSYFGLQACTTDIVVIHDAVRPFVSEEILWKNIDAAIDFGAVDTCITSTDTIVHSKDGKTITSIPNRSHYLRGQTPQSFSRSLILKAHEEAKKNNLQEISDDCRLVRELGHEVRIVSGDDANIKITTELDLFLADLLLQRKDRQPSPKQSLKNKIFAIVGGTGGIGSAIVQSLKNEGATALVLSRSADLQMDLNQPEMISRVFADIYEKHGYLDGLINCAGLLKVQSFAKLDNKEIEELLSVNLKGLILSCKEAVIKENGHIINLASSSFSYGRKDYAIYSSAKAAVVNFTQGLAEEYPKFRINTVIPQRTNTTMRKSNFPHESPKELLNPEAVAKTVVDLLKDPITTGSIIAVRKNL